jgi:hypothetical protein
MPTSRLSVRYAAPTRSPQSITYQCGYGADRMNARWLASVGMALWLMLWCGSRSARSRHSRSTASGCV